MLKRKERAGFQIEQKGENEISESEKSKVVLRFTFNLIIQLLPVWFMVLLQVVTNVKFEIEDYTSNLLVFTFISSVTNIAELSGKDYVGVLAYAIKYVLSIILCFSLFFYTLILFKKTPDMEIKDTLILYVAVCMCIIVFVAIFCQEIRKVNEKICV